MYWERDGMIWVADDRRTATRLDIVQGKSAEVDMTTMSACAMNISLSSEGRQGRFGVGSSQVLLPPY